jgi:molybdopterin synthase sulfur carrier subunit
VSAVVRLPSQLRPLADGRAELEVEGQTVGEVLTAVGLACPGLTERLFDDAGHLRRFVNVFVAEEDVRFHSGLDTPVAPGGVVSIVPAVAGG